MAIKVNTKGYGGKLLSQSAQVYTNDPENRILDLTVTGRVEKFVTIWPQVVRFRGPVGKPLEEEVKIIPEEDFPFTITGLSAESGDDIRYQLSPARFDGREGYLLVITSTREAPGVFYDVINLETDSAQTPQLKVRVHGAIFQLLDDEHPSGAMGINDESQKEPL